jgi:hypothetical protein
MDSDLQFQDRLTAELAESNPPSLGSIVADAQARGVRLRRQRHLVGAAAGLAVSVAGAVLVTAVGGGGVAAMLGQQRAEIHPAAPPATALVSVPVAQKYTSGKAVVALLLDLVHPAGQTSEVWATPLNKTDAAILGLGTATGGFLYDDGAGAASVVAGVTDHADTQLAKDFQCPPNAAGFTCTRTTVGDLQIRVFTMGPYGAGCGELKCSIKDVRVEVKRPDGVYVTIESFNGPSGQGRAATRTDTVLSVAQMTTMASDPRWGLTMDATFVDAAEANIHIGE